MEYETLTAVFGTLRLVVDVSTGEIAQRIDYDPWGVVLQDTNPGFQPFGFAGGLYDPDTGLVRFGVRDYEAYLGIWSEKEPLLFYGLEYNVYEYAHSNPTKYLDVDGLRWIYLQSTGALYYYNEVTGSSEYVGTGYSGHGVGLNNPSMENVRGVGPIPTGLWSISEPYSDPHLGPIVMALTPILATTYGRSGFRIHGDNSCHCFSASRGCIILGRNIRNLIAESEDKILEVR